VRGLQLVSGRQIADTHSFVRFSGPDGQLDQLHKAVAAGQGRSVFNGAVRVPRAAQRTNAAQLSRSLLLSDRARIVHQTRTGDRRRRREMCPRCHRELPADR